MGERKGPKALELWCKRILKDYPDISIENMTTSWRNGLAFCALIHRFRPKVIDLSSLNPDNIYYNNELAFRLAETELGIPALLDPEDMVDNEVPDRLSVLTYLSQFYQRLGHTAEAKAILDSQRNKHSPPDSPKRQFDATASSRVLSPMKAGYEKCVSCGLPVYLAQRLIVSRALYHRRCYRCARCGCQLDPSPRYLIAQPDHAQLCCDACVHPAATVAAAAVVAAADTRLHDNEDTIQPIVNQPKPAVRDRPLSLIDKINMFERNSVSEKRNSTDKVDGVPVIVVDKVDSTSDKRISVNTTEKQSVEKEEHDNGYTQNAQYKNTNNVNDTSPDTQGNTTTVEPLSEYKSDMNKFNFMRTQLADDIDSGKEDVVCLKEPLKIPESPSHLEEYSHDLSSNDIDVAKLDENLKRANLTDEVLLAKNDSKVTINDSKVCNSTVDKNLTDPEVEDKPKIIAPPRKNFPKKNTPPKETNVTVLKSECTDKTESIDYPGDLNPFSEDEEDDVAELPSKRVSTNPFGSSDEDEEEEESAQTSGAGTETTTHCLQVDQTTSRRVIVAQNPFWSDGEEPSSDEDDHNDTGYSGRSSMMASTPNLTSQGLRKKKRPAPPPPASLLTPGHDLALSTDDLASISSLSSYSSTIHSDSKMGEALTPRSRKKRPAPTPPADRDAARDNAHSPSAFSEERGGGGGGRRSKGPAPGLPLPARRVVRAQLSGTELSAQLHLLDAQQLGLERQGVLLEQMIRDKCEGEGGPTVPQEEIEDLVIQLCELVNEKNDLFRKQADLMYIRRQQRLEQEQADIEHEIRVIQSRPAVNRIDADKAREEWLVARLVQVVQQRDELVQAVERERRRERAEDLAIHTSIATRRAQRHSDSNNSSLTSIEIVKTPKKKNVKDKMKKQLKKARHSLHIKKKDDSEGSSKEKILDSSSAKSAKSKWF